MPHAQDPRERLEIEVGIGSEDILTDAMSEFVIAGSNNHVIAMTRRCLCLSAYFICARDSIVFLRDELPSV